LEKTPNLNEKSKKKTQTKVWMVLFVLLGLLISPVFALQFYGNQSSEQWKSAESEHFRFYFPVENQHITEKAVLLAESVFDSISSRYRIPPDQKIHFVLRNGLYSNGMSVPSANLLYIWNTDWEFKVRTTHHWMNDVVAHEFAHLVSIRAGTKLDPFWLGLFVSYQDYHNESVRSDWAANIPSTVFPIWFAEGTAQYESSRLGFDRWDTHRDMILRTAVLNDDLLTLQDMNAFPESDMFDGEKGGYNQGFALVRYIAREFGDDKIPRLWSELALAGRFSMGAALKKVIGLDDQELYQRWQVSIQKEYQTFMDSLGTPVEGFKLSDVGYLHDHPRSTGGYLYGVSNFGAPSFAGGLFRLPLNRDSLPEEQQPDSAHILDLSTFADSVPFEPYKSYVEKGFDVFEAPGISPQMVFTTYRHRDDQGRLWFDLALNDTTGSGFLQKTPRGIPLTRFQDAVDPVFSPDGREIAFVRREKGGNRFILSRLSLPCEFGPSNSDTALPLCSDLQKQDPQSIETPEVTDLVVPAPNQDALTILSPRWSPDGTRIAFSYFDGTNRQIGSIDYDGSNFQILVSGPGDHRDPAWSPDGKHLIFSSDRSGVFNLYRLDLQTGLQQPLTKVSGGAFTPEWTSQGVYYTQYDKDGFSLYQLPDSLVFPADSLALKHIPRNPLPDMRRTIEPAPASVLEGRVVNYRPIPTIVNGAPIFAMEEQGKGTDDISSGELKYLLGAAVAVSDPLQKNMIEMMLLLELGQGWNFINSSGINPDKGLQASIFWVNRSTPITFSLGGLYRNFTAQDTVFYEDTRSHPEPWALSYYAVAMRALEGSAGYSIFKKGDSLSVGAGLSRAEFNLYEDNFAWDYHEQEHIGMQFRWSKGPDPFAANAEGKGFGVLLSGDVSQNNLFRPGTFQESFKVENGVISPVYRKFTLKEGGAMLWGRLSNPFHPGAGIVMSAQETGILDWQVHNSDEDTLDFYFHHRLNQAGYPFLADSENLLLHGKHTLLLQAHYLFPIYKELDFSFWTIRPRNMYASLFGQLGRAWDGMWWDSGFNDYAWNGFLRSAGLEFRWENQIFYRQPLAMYLRFSRALDPVQMRDGRKVDIEPLDFGWLPGNASPTRVQFGINFGLSHPAFSHSKNHQLF